MATWVRKQVRKDVYFLTLLAAALAPITAIVAIYLAFRQFQLQREQLRLQLYERRAQAFKAYLDLLNKAVFTNMTPDDVLAFRAAIFDAPFLFDKSEADLLAEVADSANRSAGSRPILEPENIDDPARRANVVRMLAETRNWYHEKLKEAHSRFAKYLRTG